MPARPTHASAARQRGSVAMALIVIMVATIMVVALLVTTQIGLRSARRSGDSANALQLADAGINDAAKAVTAHSSSFSDTSSLGTAGSYTYTATKDGAVWRLDATGTDATGVKRRVLADAVDQPLFGHAFFALAASELKGTADSYTGPSITFGTDPGSCKSVINAPPAATCSSGGYQSGWPATLQINAAGSGTVDFANHSIFWGVVNAPTRVFNASGTGTPQVEVFGAVLATSASAAAQFEFHYDQSLKTSLTTGQYRVTNWREEASG